MLCNERSGNENATNIEKIYDKKELESYYVRVELASNLLNFS